ncbi:hypothetical protein lerEdw1_014100 [Lerista edwardsae]|nr:hypothetical protein lerEdw1_014100 [Lerista edwardsae]
MEAPFLKLVSYYRQTFDAFCCLLNTGIFFSQYTVLDVLTPSQIGDMMVHSDTLTSMDLATRLVTFFQERDVERVQIILKEFTRAAIQHKLVVLPNPQIAQFLLTSYLALAAAQMEAYTAAEWNTTLQVDLRFFCPVIDTTSLDYFTPQDYESFTTM